jgi:hypothetical protein
LKSNSGLLVLAAAPPVLVACCALLLGSGLPIVTTRFWPVSPTNVAEAALLGDAARVRLLAARGAPLDASLPVRAEIRERDEPSTMTPLEAAARHDGDSLVGVLFDLGLRPPPDEKRRLYCLAVELGTAAADELRAAFKPGPDPCAR